MTLKFFALFFMQVVNMGPMAVSLLGALSPLGVSAASLACQPLSKVVGRVQIRWVLGTCASKVVEWLGVAWWLPGGCQVVASRLRGHRVCAAVGMNTSLL